MRSDESTAQIDEEDWRQGLVNNSEGEAVERIRLSGSRKARMSFSGHERNKLFIKVAGEFQDLSGLSGLDTDLDSRNIAMFDYNRDGFQDFLVTNTNGQLLQIFRNNLSELQSTKGNFICVKLVGAKRDNRSDISMRSSNRDGVGAWITVQAGELNLDREMRCGEGFASQNSQTIVLGIGSAKLSDAVTVCWPSGKKTVAKQIPSRSLITIFEEKEDSKSGAGFDLSSYQSIEEPVESERSASYFPISQFPFESDKPVILLTSMATWCKSSRRSLQVIEAINKKYSNSVDCFAFSTDKFDSKEKLDAYRLTFDPAYRLIVADEEAIDAFQNGIKARHGDAPLPSTILMSAEGGVLGVFVGVPSLSAVAHAIDEARSR